jgi:hypothetical protein
LFCEPGTVDDVKSARTVCQNLDKLSQEVKTNSAVEKFCAGNADSACD